MRKLFIDTSTDFLFVFFIEDDSILFYKIQEGKNNHSEHLMEIIKEGLLKRSMKMQDFDQIYVGIGPGSYTGLRLSLTVAKMIAWTLQKDLFTFSSLDLVASSFILQDGTYMPRIKAKKGYSYVNVINVQNQKVTVIEEDVFLSNDEVDRLQNTYKSITCDPGQTVNPVLLLKHCLYEKVEDVYAVVPRYLRGEL